MILKCNYSRKQGTKVAKQQVIIVTMEDIIGLNFEGAEALDNIHSLPHHNLNYRQVIQEVKGPISILIFERLKKMISPSSFLIRIPNLTVTKLTFEFSL